MSDNEERHQSADFDTIYREHLPFVWRSLGGLGVGEAQVEDLAHEVFIVVYRRLGDLDASCQVRTWIYGIVRRIAANARRASMRAERKSIKFKNDPGLCETSSSDLDRGVARGEAANVIDSFLLTLDDVGRELFWLSEIEECSGREISDMTSMNINTVHARLRKIRASFDWHIQELNRKGVPAPTKEVYV
jgi:RNA polymerase sigma-70 factor (ECF subfamily)